MAKEHRLPPIRCMHEWPLVLFTALAVPAAGAYAAVLVGDTLGLDLRMPVYLHAVAIGLLAAGLAFSLLHLGRPDRAPLALWRVGRNALSTEAALAAILLVLIVPLLVPTLASVSALTLRHLAGVCAGALLVTLGLVYFLRAHWPWRTALVIGPLLSGLAAGSVIASTPPGNASLQPVVFVLLTLDAALCLSVWRELRVAGTLPAHPAVHEYRRRLLFLRLVFANLLPAGLLLAGFRPSAAIAVGVGVLLDRFSFYGLARVQTTEASVAEVERRIERAR